jgi:hypothetical protein
MSRDRQGAVSLRDQIPKFFFGRRPQIAHESPLGQVIDNQSKWAFRSQPDSHQAPAIPPHRFHCCYLRKRDSLLSPVIRNNQFASGVAYALQPQAEPQHERRSQDYRDGDKTKLRCHDDMPICYEDGHRDHGHPCRRKGIFVEKRNHFAGQPRCPLRADNTIQDVRRLGPHGSSLGASAWGENRGFA